MHVESKAVIFAVTKFVLVLTALLSPLRSIMASERLDVVAASDLTFVFPDLTSAFKIVHPGIEVAARFGASGALFEQVRSGAPADVFLSADLRYPEELAKQALVVPSIFRYAEGDLVLWVRKDSNLPIEKLGLLTVLERSVNKIAIASPRHAPYGRAAIEALTSQKLLGSVQPKLVYGENIAQAAQFAQTGAADLALISSSIAMSPRLKETGRFEVIPASFHKPIEQGGAILERAKDKKTAVAFREFLLSASAREIFKKHGYR